MNRKKVYGKEKILWYITRIQHERCHTSIIYTKSCTKSVDNLKGRGEIAQPCPRGEKPAIRIGADLLAGSKFFGAPVTDADADADGNAEAGD